MKKAVLIVISLVLAGMIALSVVLIVQAVRSDGDVIRIQTDGGTAEESAFRVEGMLPGDSATRTYIVGCGEGGTLNVTFEAGGEAGLLPYVTARVEIGGEERFSGALQDLIGSPLVCSASGDTYVTVEYGLPLGVGNEAQGAALDLKLSFAFTNEKES